MPDAAPNGRNFGQYEVESVLGRGAMGMVYLARDRRIGRRVALKTVQLDQKFEDESEADEFYKRLQREAEVVGAMQHPNIVTLYEPGYENNVISYLATEYVDGESLKERLKRSKPLPVDEALRYAEDLLRALAYAHAKGIIHRDIKPANILLSSDGQAKLADFGIARPSNSNLTAAGSMLGTPNYMSPEQVKCSPVTTKSDLFAVGIVMYEMLTGTKPFSAPDISGILRAIVERKPPPASEINRNVPEPVAKFVDRLLAKEPEERMTSASAALAELQQLRAAAPPPVTREMEVSTLAAPPSRVLVTPPAEQSAGTSLTQQTTIVPAPVFWGVIAALIVPLLMIALAIHSKTNDKGTAELTSQPTRHTDNKKKEAQQQAATLSSQPPVEPAKTTSTVEVSEKRPPKPLAVPILFNTYFKSPFTDGTLVVKIGRDLVANEPLFEKPRLRRARPREINVTKKVTAKSNSVDVTVVVPSLGISEHFEPSHPDFKPSGAYRLIIAFDASTKRFSSKLR